MAVVDKDLDPQNSRAIEVAANDAEYVDLVTNKLKFPVKVVGSQALTADIESTMKGLRDVIANTL